MATREKATPSAGARSKASGSGRERVGATATTAAKPAASAKPAAGAARGKPATLGFLAGWREELQGEIVPGGKLRVEYAPERLPDYRGTHKNKPTWDIVGTVLFSPGGQLQSGSVAKKPLEVVVPRDASNVTLWFQNTDGSGGAAWDSRYGDNYHFNVSGGAAGSSGAGAAGRAAGGTRARAKTAAAGSAGAAGGGRSGGAGTGAGGARATGGSTPRASTSRTRRGS